MFITKKKNLIPNITILLALLCIAFSLYCLAGVIKSGSVRAKQQGTCIAKLISLEVERADIIKTIDKNGMGSCKRK